MKGKILIVDDEAELRAMLKSILEDNDYTVTLAEDAAALQKFYSQDAPDVVLLDLKLPDANGLDLLPQIKKYWPHTEVMMITGYATL